LVVVTVETGLAETVGQVVPVAVVVEDMGHPGFLLHYKEHPAVNLLEFHRAAAAVGREHQELTQQQAAELVSQVVLDILHQLQDQLHIMQAAVVVEDIRYLVQVA
jgi:hypothetical protein